MSVAGPSLATVTDTVAAPGVADPLHASPIDPPTLKMTFGVNDSKLGGREGKNLTGRAIWDRLVAEAETNVALRVLQQEGGGGDRFEVQGRGELHLGVLIETMRRENFGSRCRRCCISPTPIGRGKRLEPLEEVLAEVDEEHVGGVIEALSLRKGELIDMQHGAGEGGKTRLEFRVPSRGLIWFRSVFINETRGTGTMHPLVRRVRRVPGRHGPRAKGHDHLVRVGGDDDVRARAAGGARVDVRGPEGGGVRGHDHRRASRDESLEVNGCKEKKLTNMRLRRRTRPCASRRQAVMTLEEAIGVQSDELIEVTPSVRSALRKAELDSGKRNAQSRKAAKA